MEKPENPRSDSDQKSKPLVWDCGSSLYDSFELNSFKRQLDSAIISSSARSFSMPHLSDHRRVLPAPEKIPQPQTPAKKSSSSKISRSINKLLRSIFKPKLIGDHRSSSSSVEGPIFVVYDKTGALTTIPEAPEIEFGGFSPEISSLVKRTGSERFVPTGSIGISCA